MHEQHYSNYLTFSSLKLLQLNYFPVHPPAYFEFGKHKYLKMRVKRSPRTPCKLLHSVVCNWTIP